MLVFLRGLSQLRSGQTNFFIFFKSNYVRQLIWLDSPRPARYHGRSIFIDNLWVVNANAERCPRN